MHYYYFASFIVVWLLFRPLSLSLSVSCWKLHMVGSIWCPQETWASIRTHRLIEEAWRVVSWPRIVSNFRTNNTLCDVIQYLRWILNARKSWCTRISNGWTFLNYYFLGGCQRHVAHVSSFSNFRESNVSLYFQLNSAYDTVSFTRNTLCANLDDLLRYYEMKSNDFLVQSNRHEFLIYSNGTDGVCWLLIVE